MSLNQALPKLDELALPLVGMTCEGCARAVERVLSSLPGVKTVAVDFARSLAVVRGAVPATELVAAVEAAGLGIQARRSGAGGERNGGHRCGCCS